MDYLLSCARLQKLQDTLKTIAQLERSMQSLRRWLIETEHMLNMPLVFEHCDFAEIEKHINCQQVTEPNFLRLKLL